MPSSPAFTRIIDTLGNATDCKLLGKLLLEINNQAVSGEFEVTLRAGSKAPEVDNTTSYHNAEPVKAELSPEC